MSVKVHEPVCLDSAQDKYIWFDHFLGDQLKDEWRVTTVGTGSVAVIDLQTGGIVRLNVPANLDNVVLNWSDIRSLHVDQRVSMEVRLKQTNNDSSTFIFLYKDVDECLGFYHNPGTNWYIICSNVAFTQHLTGITPDTSYHIFRIEAFPAGEIHFFIDDVELPDSPITTNIPADADDFLQPHLRNLEGGAGTVVDVDYVVVRQER